MAASIGEFWLSILVYLGQEIWQYDETEERKTNRSQRRSSKCNRTSGNNLPLPKNSNEHQTKLHKFKNLYYRSFNAGFFLKKIFMLSFDHRRISVTFQPLYLIMQISIAKSNVSWHNSIRSRKSIKIPSIHPSSPVEWSCNNRNDLLQNVGQHVTMNQLVDTTTELLAKPQ